MTPLEAWTHDARGRRLSVNADPYPTSPRQDPKACVGRFIAIPDRKYTFGDDVLHATDRHTPVERLSQRMQNAQRRGGYARSVWCYEHGAVAFLLGTPTARPPGGDVFDTRPVGGYFVAARARRRYRDDDALETAIRAELKAYEDWVNGDVYLVSEETAHTCPHCQHREWLDSEPPASFYGIEAALAYVYQQGGFTPDTAAACGWRQTAGA